MEKIILVDTSGSMAEEGKKSVIRYLLYAIEGIFSDEWPTIPYRIFLWNEEISEFESKVEFGGKSNVSVLSFFLSEHSDSAVLLISDGSYSEEIKSVLKRADKKIIALMVGSDCNKARLQKMVGTENLYETADVATCIKDFIHIV
jgi:uncharacterized protein with von Willebrand factor type A (vWA) domain